MIKGLLIDLDGVVYNDSQPISGADRAIAYLQKLGIPFRFITNTTMKSRETLVQKLHAMGIGVQPDHVFSAVSAAADFLRRQSQNKSFLVLTDDAKKEFQDIPQGETKVNFVVLGDLGEAFTMQILNRAFNCLMEGAELIALQKNRFWLSDEGYRMDAGAFVALLEYAANKKARLIGKPAEAFYRAALESLNLSPPHVLMVGDDMESDISGAKRLGLQTCLVQTGKFRPVDLQNSVVKPDRVVPSIAQLPQLLKDWGTLFAQNG